MFFCVCDNRHMRWVLGALGMFIGSCGILLLTSIVKSGNILRESYFFERVIYCG